MVLGQSGGIGLSYVIGDDDYGAVSDRERFAITYTEAQGKCQIPVSIGRVFQESGPVVTPGLNQFTVFKPGNGSILTADLKVIQEVRGSPFLICPV